MMSGGKPLIIVSGLPRSGTSLMMQMLAAGGVGVVDDQQRLPDENNPRGYFEDQRVRTLHLDTSWLSGVEGKALKVVSPLLHHLPETLNYQILFMERPLEEVLRSQHAMLERLGKDDTLAGLEDKFRAHLEQVFPWIEANPQMELLRIPFPELVHSPDPLLERIAAFLATPIDRAAMRACIQQDLYRSRGEGMP